MGLTKGRVPVCDLRMRKEARQSVSSDLTRTDWWRQVVLDQGGRRGGQEYCTSNKNVGMGVYGMWDMVIFFRVFLFFLSIFSFRVAYAVRRTAYEFLGV